MDVKFHLTSRFQASLKRSKHSVDRCLGDLKTVLTVNPEFGVPIPKYSKLRKMRVRVPHLNLGKSGGYRLIYRRSIIDEIQYLVFLDIYFKGDKEDLSASEYQRILAESENIVTNILDFDWVDAPRI